MMNKHSAEVNELIGDVLSQTADLSQESRKTLVTKWKQASRGHIKNASYYRKQGQFTRKRQEEAMAEVYEAAARALEEALE